MKAKITRGVLFLRGLIGTQHVFRFYSSDKLSPDFGIYKLEEHPLREMIKNFRDTRTAFDEKLSVLYAQAISLVQNQNYSKAIEEFHTIINSCAYEDIHDMTARQIDTISESYLRLAEIYSIGSSQEEQKALEYAKKALDLCPSKSKPQIIIKSIESENITTSKYLQASVEECRPTRGRMKISSNFDQAVSTTNSLEIPQFQHGEYREYETRQARHSSTAINNHDKHEHKSTHRNTTSLIAKKNDQNISKFNYKLSKSSLWNKDNNSKNDIVKQDMLNSPTPRLVKYTQ